MYGNQLTCTLYCTCFVQPRGRLQGCAIESLGALIFSNKIINVLETKSASSLKIHTNVSINVYSKNMLFLPFVFYVHEDGHMVGRNMQEFYTLHVPCINLVYKGLKRSTEYFTVPFMSSLNGLDQNSLRASPLYVIPQHFTPCITTFYF